VPPGVGLRGAEGGQRRPRERAVRSGAADVAGELLVGAAGDQDGSLSGAARRLDLLDALGGSQLLALQDDGRRRPSMWFFPTSLIRRRVAALGPMKPSRALPSRPRRGVGSPP
jgi:hypothetical protein